MAMNILILGQQSKCNVACWIAQLKCKNYGGYGNVTSEILSYVVTQQFYKLVGYYHNNFFSFLCVFF